MYFQFFLPFLSAVSLSKSSPTLLSASSAHIFQISSRHQSLRFSSLSSVPLYFHPACNSKINPKQNYQRGHGLGAKCWMYWMDIFEVYRALRQKCHHWNLSVILCPLNASLLSTAPPPHYRSGMQPAASEKSGLYLTIHIFLSLLSPFKVLEKHKEVDCGFEATKGWDGIIEMWCIFGFEEDSWRIEGCS